MAATAMKSGDKSDDSSDSKDSYSGGVVAWTKSRLLTHSSNGDNNKDKSSKSSSDSVGSMISGSNPTTKATEFPS